jgi:1,2-dihydroxy-3-keto-5-methylthiopentene dioxygenase
MEREEMTLLTIYADTDGREPVRTLTDFEGIRDALASIGVEFERWEASQPLDEKAGQDEVIAAYRDSIDRLNAKYGFQSIDVVSMYPDHPQKDAARGKFLAEHTHADFEIRFFVDGAGMFYIHHGGKVYATLCTRGDLINLPANLTHWFDMGPSPNFKAIRLFTTPDGWVGNFSGSDIADRFPRFEAAA